MMRRAGAEPGRSLGRAGSEPGPGQDRACSELVLSRGRAMAEPGPSRGRAEGRKIIKIFLYSNNVKTKIKISKRACTNPTIHECNV